VVSHVLQQCSLSPPQHTAGMHPVCTHPQVQHTYIQLHVCVDVCVGCAVVWVCEGGYICVDVCVGCAGVWMCEGCVSVCGCVRGVGLCVGV